MHKVIDGGKLEFAKSGEAGVEARYDNHLETRYDYYRRCQAFRANGVQCKAPAMKDHDICRKHAEQREKTLRAEGQRRDFIARTSENPEGKDAEGGFCDAKTHDAKGGDAKNGEAMSINRTSVNQTSVNQTGFNQTGFNQTIRDLMQAMLDGRIDEDTAGAMLDEIALKLGLLSRFPGQIW